jgi:hypothetical protein
MQEIVRGLSQHPLVVIAGCLAVLLILYILFKHLIKLFLVMLIVVAVIVGYYYFRPRPSKPADVTKAVEEVRIGADRAMEDGKDTVEKGRELIGKGKAVLNVGIEKGKEIVDTGKEAVDEIGKILGGKTETGKKQEHAPGKRD